MLSIKIFCNKFLKIFFGVRACSPTAVVHPEDGSENKCTFKYFRCYKKKLIFDFFPLLNLKFINLFSDLCDCVRNLFSTGQQLSICSVQSVYEIKINFYLFYIFSFSLKCIPFFCSCPPPWYVGKIVVLFILGISSLQFQLRL